MTTENEQNQPTQIQPPFLVLPVTIMGNGKLRQIELSKKDWSITRENNDRWLFTEVRP